MIRSASRHSMTLKTIASAWLAFGTKATSSAVQLMIRAARE
jgi:hypothetical protein